MSSYKWIRLIVFVVSLGVTGAANAVPTSDEFRAPWAQEDLGGQSLMRMYFYGLSEGLIARDVVAAPPESGPNGVLFCTSGRHLDYEILLLQFLNYLEGADGDQSVTLAVMQFLHDEYPCPGPSSSNN